MAKGRWLVNVGLVAVFVVGWLLFSTVVFVRRVVLHEDTYTSSLVSTDAYNRFYTEVLADPEMADVQAQLLGRLGLGPAASEEVRVAANNVLRLAVSPSVLRSATEEGIGEILRYVRGDSDRLDVDVAVERALASIDDAAVVEARTALAAAVDHTAASLPAYEDAVRAFAEELAAGTVPDTIPDISATTFGVEPVVQAILDGLGPIVTDEVRQQVLAAVTVGDERNALISAASGLVSSHAAAVAAQLRAETITGGDFDVVAAIGEHAHEPAQSVVDSLDAVRNAASWFRPLTALVGALLALAAAIGLVWLHRESPRRALGVLAIALVVAGCVQLLVWLMAAWLVPTPFDPATSAGSVSWDLPSGLRSLLSDIQHALLGDVVRFGVWMALVVVVPGIVLGAVVVFAGVRIRRSMLMVVTAIGVVVAGVAVLGSARLARTPVARGCNGHAELCDRHYNDVVFAATHNSMSSPDVVRVWPEQDDDLGEQLDAGVRALLIDTHYWPPVRSARDLLEVQSAVAPDAPPVPQSVADALYPTLGSLRDGRPGTFLCHAHCAFGEQPFLDGLVSVRRFLEANPDEVVTLIIQDAISTPDTVAAMHAAGLDRYLYEHRRDHTWPTLGQMIDDGQRLVVFAEVAGPPPGWYANAFQEMQETGFTTPSPSAFSCAANRGPSDAPLFLMNHWVARGAPDRVNATIVNTKDFLVERARACARDRGLRPNFIAVDFSNIGDVVGAVDELNGVSS